MEGLLRVITRSTPSSQCARARWAFRRSCRASGRFRSPTARWRSACGTGYGQTSAQYTQRRTATISGQRSASARAGLRDDRSAAVGHNAGPAVVVAEIVAKHDRGPAQTLVRLPGACRQWRAVLRDQRRCPATFRRAPARARARFFHSSPAQALVYVEACASKGDALRREIAIKRLDKRAKERLVSQAGPVA